MCRRPRHGFALLAAMVLMALASALVVSTMSVSLALRRAATTTYARARVESGATRAVGEVLQQWSADFDSLPAGASVAVTIGTDSLDEALPVLRRARVAHVANGLFVVTVDVCAFDWTQPVAQRRLRLWLQRPSGTGDSARPALVTSWAFSDLY